MRRPCCILFLTIWWRCFDFAATIETETAAKERRATRSGGETKGLRKGSTDSNNAILCVRLLWSLWVEVGAFAASLLSALCCVCEFEWRATVVMSLLKSRAQGFSCREGACMFKVVVVVVNCRSANKEG